MNYKIFSLGLLFLASCGLPVYVDLDSPTVIDTDDNYTLSFTPSADADMYIVMYKFYWYGEDDIEDDEDEFDDDDSLSLGYYLPKSLGFVQVYGYYDSSGSSTASNPVDTSDISLNTTGGDVVLDFDVDTSSLLTVSVSAGASESNLYRRAVEASNISGYSDEDTVYGKYFFNNDYDYNDYEDYEPTSGVTIDEDGDGIDSDLEDLLDSDRFDTVGDLYSNSSLVVAFVVYSYGLDMDSFSAIESIPVYLGTIEINNDDWYN